MDRIEAAAVLGVESDADASVVAHAYRVAARLLHPDRWAKETQADQDAAAAAMSRLNEAKRVMSGGAPWWSPRVDAQPKTEPVTVPSSGAFAFLPPFLSGLIPPLGVVREARDFLDNPYALQGLLILAVASLMTGVIGAFWLFISLAVWVYVRRIRVAAV